VAESDQHDRPRTITDSAWFWVLVFSLGALLALQAASSKYAVRQSQIERQYQGRQYAAEQGQAGKQEPPEFSTPENTLIALWPLKGLALLLAVLSVVILVRRERSGA